MTNSKEVFTLRPVARSDAPRIAELIGDWEVVRWLSLPPHPYNLCDAEAFLATCVPADARGESQTGAIVVAGQFAGIIGIGRTGGSNLGYWLGRAYWGQGIMTRAAMQITRDFFANTAETRLKSGYFSGNEVSWAIQRRLGFEFVSEGLLLNRPHGKRLPHVETTLTREQFEVLHPNGATLK